MLSSFKHKAKVKRKAGELYGVIVTQARAPFFYADLGIPDTPSGRYETLVLHLFLVLERLRADGERAGRLPRALVEVFVADMDDSLRELGTGDVAMAKKVRRATAGLYERGVNYRSALADPLPEHLEQALASHTAARSPKILARHVRLTVDWLARQGGADLIEGQMSFLTRAPGEDAK